MVSAAKPVNSDRVAVTEILVCIGELIY